MAQNGKYQGTTRRSQTRTTRVEAQPLPVRHNPVAPELCGQHPGLVTGLTSSHKPGPGYVQGTSEEQQWEWGRGWLETVLKTGSLQAPWSGAQVQAQAHSSALRLLMEAMENMELFNQQKTTLLHNFAQHHSHYNTMNTNKILCSKEAGTFIPG